MNISEILGAPGAHGGRGRVCVWKEVYVRIWATYIHPDASLFKYIQSYTYISRSILTSSNLFSPILFCSIVLSAMQTYSSASNSMRICIRYTAQQWPPERIGVQASPYMVAHVATHTRRHVKHGSYMRETLPTWNGHRSWGLKNHQPKSLRWTVR